MSDLKSLEVKKPEEAPKPLEVKMPEKTVKLLEELKVKEGKLANQFYNISFQIGEMIDKQNEIRRMTKENGNRMGKEIKRAFNKLKLKNKKEYRWSHNRKDMFIGNLVPEKPKK